MKRILLFFVAILSTNFHVLAQMPKFTPEVKRAAVFKNGYAFTYREGEATTGNGWAYTNSIPAGVLGTVWGYSTTPNVKINQLVASEVTNIESDSVRMASLLQILIANENSRIRFQTNFYNEKKSYEGNFTVIGNDSQAAIALKTEAGTLFVPFASIYNIELLDKIEMQKIEKSVVSNTRLSLKVDGAPDGQKINLGIAALERGIRWIPAYRVEVKGEPIKEAKLELEAMLINDLTDLKNTDVYFVVGVPSFLFQDEVSPLSLNTAFAGVSTGFRRDMGNIASNSIMTQVAGQRMGDDRNISPTSDDEEQGAGFSAEQLYLYQANQVNLKKGERMSQRLFSLTVPCSEVFEWTINDSTQTDASYARSMPITQPLVNQVWYGLRLKNTTGMPWTTAPAIGFRDWKPLGQNMMTFTPNGGENILRIAPATEIIGTHNLEEKSREPKQIRYSGSSYDYDLVTVEGTIKLKNVKKQPVEIVLTRNVTGDVLSATENGKISREGFNLQAVNPNSIIKWNLTLPTGEKEIKYSYKVFVRR